MYGLYTMKANPEKIQFIILGKTSSHTLQIDDITIKSASPVVLLGITIDVKLNFKEHVNNIVKNAYYKLYALRRLQKFLTLKSQHFSLFNDRKSIHLLPIILDVILKNRNERSEKVQYKTLLMVYNNYMATYDDLLALDNKLKIHQRHLQFLAIEIYKSTHKLNPSFMWITYEDKNIPYLLRRGILLLFKTQTVRKYG